MIEFKEEHQDETITPEIHNGLTIYQIGIVLINTLIGTGPMKLGSTFSCGVILAPIITGIIALINIYALFLFSKAAVKFHCPTMEEIITEAFSPFICHVTGIFSMIYTFGIDMIYWNFISTNLYKLLVDLKVISKDTLVFLNEKITLCMIVFIVFGFYYVHTKKIKSIFHICYLAFFVIIIMLLLSAYQMIWVSKPENYVLFFGHSKTDPNRGSGVHLFRFDSTAVDCISSMMTAFQIFPFNYPGVGHLKNNSVRNCMKSFSFAYAFTWAASCAFGILNSIGGNIFSAENSILRPHLIVARAMIILLTTLSIPIMLNPARFFLIDCFLHQTVIESQIWCFLGYCFLIISMFLSTVMSNRIVDFSLNLMLNIMSPFMTFICPAAVFLKGFGRQSLMHFYSASFVVVIGFGLIGFNLYMQFAS